MIKNLETLVTLKKKWLINHDEFEEELNILKNKSTILDYSNNPDKRDKLIELFVQWEYNKLISVCDKILSDECYNDLGALFWKAVAYYALGEYNKSLFSLDIIEEYSLKEKKSEDPWIINLKWMNYYKKWEYEYAYQLFNSGVLKKNSYWIYNRLLALYKFNLSDFYRDLDEVNKIYLNDDNSFFWVSMLFIWLQYINKMARTLLNWRKYNNNSILFEDKYREKYLSKMWDYNELNNICLINLWDISWGKEEYFKEHYRKKTKLFSNITHEKAFYLDEINMFDENIYLKKSTQLFDDEKYQKALEYYEKAIQLSPEDENYRLKNKIIIWIANLDIDEHIKNSSYDLALEIAKKYYLSEKILFVLKEQRSYWLLLEECNQQIKNIQLKKENENIIEWFFNNLFWWKDDEYNIILPYLMEALENLWKYNELIDIYNNLLNNEKLIKKLDFWYFQVSHKLWIVYKKNWNYLKSLEILEKLDKNSYSISNDLEDLYEEIIQKKKFHEINKSEFDMIYELSIRYKQKNNITKCNEFLNKALNIEPNNPDLLALQYIISKNS